MCFGPGNSHQTLKKDEYYALLSVADLAVITPLRDGMNTTSMEFVIAQESTNKSPSVLSEFMGISKNMEDSLLVNPWNLGVCVFFLTKMSFFSLVFYFDSIYSLFFFSLRRMWPPPSTKVSSWIHPKKSIVTQSFTRSLLLILRILGLRFWSRCCLARWGYRVWQDKPPISRRSNWRDCT